MNGKTGDKNKTCRTYDLAKQVNRNSRYIDSLKIYSDYQWGDPVWHAWGLTDINQWSPCLRIDANVSASAKTHLLRSTLNCRVDIGQSLVVHHRGEIRELEHGVPAQDCVPRLQDGRRDVLTNSHCDGESRLLSVAEGHTFQRQTPVNRARYLCHTQCKPSQLESSAIVRQFPCTLRRGQWCSARGRNCRRRPQSDRAAGTCQCAHRPHPLAHDRRRPRVEHALQNLQ